GFLGVMLFGLKRVGPGLHFLSTVAVAVGTLISATWILASSSWMHTPQGYEIIDGRVVPVDWLAVIFNPSFPYRLSHMVVAAFLATALVVGASGAWQLLRGRDNAAVRTMLSMAMWMLLVAAPIQALLGDMHGLNTLKYQPAKIAAMEGHWRNTPGESMPLLLFGIPDMQAEETKYAIGVPKLGSLVLTHSIDGQVPGLAEFAPEDRPNALVVFWTFRAMVGLGLLMIGLALLALLARWRGQLYSSRLVLRYALLMGPAGLAAILAGWLTTEIGRQPWIVYGLMRTVDAASPHAAATVAFTLAMFMVVYFTVFGAGTVYALRIIAKGPEAGESDHPVAGGPGESRTPSRPLSVAPEKRDAGGGLADGEPR
ncbi:MAG: cytochrome ubiquinol oxidase subunit I, partial [Arenimonas sp.]